MSDQPPAQIALRKGRRSVFVTYLVLVFLILTVAAWWVVPNFAAHTRTLLEGSRRPVPNMTAFFLSFVGWFKVLWVFCAAGAVVLGYLGGRGFLDPFLPVLNLLLVIAGVAVVALCFVSYYLPMLGAASSLGP